METKFFHNKPTLKKLTGLKSGIDFDPAIISMTIRKDIAQPAGIFKVELDPYGFPSPDSTISMLGKSNVIGYSTVPNDMFQIGFTSKCVMLGLVDHSYTVETYDKNSVSKTRVISGRDFGKAFITDNADTIWADIPDLEEALPADHALFSKYRRIASNALFAVTIEMPDGQKRTVGLNENPVDTIEWLVYNLPSMSMLDAEEGVMRDRWFTFGTHGDDGPNVYEGDRINQPMIGGYTGNIWSALTSCLDDFYEIWVDTAFADDLGRPLAVLRVRPKPFDRVGDKVGDKTVEGRFTWEKFTNFIKEVGSYNGNTYGYHRIDDFKLIEKGRNDYEVYSAFDVSASNSLSERLIGGASGNAAKAFISVDSYLLLKYGYRKLTINSQLAMDVGLEGSDNVINHSRIKVDRAYNWYRHNAIMESGSLTLPCNDHIRVGDKIWIPDLYTETGFKGMVFYVKTVDIEYHREETPVPRMTLGIARGFNQQECDEFDQNLNKCDGNVFLEKKD